MISYSTLGTDDMDRSIVFYDHVFGAIDGIREVTSETWVQYGRENEKGKVCLTLPHDGLQLSRCVPCRRSGAWRLR